MLYDQPSLKPTSTDNRLSPGPLFDDPGYNRGFMGQVAASQPQDIADVNDGGTSEDVFHTLGSPNSSIARVAIRVESVGARVLGEGPDIGNQMAEMKRSVGSLALLDYQDEELQDLHPDIASCLVDTEISAN